MGALDTTRGAMRGHPFGQGGLPQGAIKRPGGGPVGLGLLPQRDLSWRDNIAIPTGGVPMHVATGGAHPYTYAATNLPAGITLNTAGTTPFLEGTPTTVGTETVTYTATDADGSTADSMFSFAIIFQNARLQRDDWDNRRLGLGTKATYLLAILRSTVDTGFAILDIWRRPPQSGTEVGELLDDDGNVITDYSDMTFTEGGESIFVQRLQTRESQDRVVLYESSSLHFGDYVRGTLMSPSVYLRIESDIQEVPYERAFGNDAQFRRSTPDLGEFLREIDNNVVFLLAVAESS